jgi:hypothetical protein
MHHPQVGAVIESRPRAHPSMLQSTGVIWRHGPTAIVALAAASFCLAGCAVTSPIQPANSSKSAFEGAVYKGTTVVVSPGTPGNEAYRVFIQGATGFVSQQSVRDDAEQRAKEFCDRKGKVMESLTERTANPPYILGNFPPLNSRTTSMKRLS